MNLTFMPMNEASAYLITGWHYTPPYHIYDFASSEPAHIKTAVSYFTDPQNQFYRMIDEQGKLAKLSIFKIGIQVNVPYRHEGVVKVTTTNREKLILAPHRR